MKTTVTLPWSGWEITKQLGSGGFGQVFEIRRPLPGGIYETAAAKCVNIPNKPEMTQVLRDEGRSDKEIELFYLLMLSEMEKEYALMAQMKGNVHIVHSEDFARVKRKDGLGWQLFIRMELLTPLQSKGETFTPETAARVGMDICSALAGCRKRGIIHRDIKPDNIMRSEDGTYKLGDFGISKLSEMEVHHTVAGTPPFMAPEILNNQPYTASVDIYELGLALYWMLNRRRLPFLPLPPKTPTAEDFHKAVAVRVAGTPIPEPADGSSELKRVVLKACAFDPEKRWKTPEEFASALNRAVHHVEDPARGSDPHGGAGAAHEKVHGAGAEKGKDIPVHGNPALDAQVSLRLTAKEMADGCTKELTTPLGESINCKIPAGVRDGKILTVPGYGQKDPATGKRGNLCVKVSLRKNFLRPPTSGK